MLKIKPPRTNRDVVIWLLWLYIAFLLFEGALRKWFLVPLETPLLVVRDPIVILIYLFAARAKILPSNPYVAATFLLAVLSFFFGVISGDSNFIVTLYGLRINYLQIPLIFVIGRALTRADLIRISVALLWVSIPIAILTVLQFYAPQTSFINRQVGGASGMSGAMGRFRPSATFSFVTGIAYFYPIIGALSLGFLYDARRKYLLLCFLSLLGIVLAVFFSISRLTFISCFVVLLTAVFCLFKVKSPPKSLVRGIMAAVFLIAVIPFLPFFQEGVETFMSRWDDATGEEAGGVREAIWGRFFRENVLFPLHTLRDAPVTGYGVGLGSNVGAKFTTGKVGFNLGESELQRNINELGPLLGVAFIALRLSLFIYLLKRSLAALRRNDPLPLMLLSACGLLLINGQWGPPTILGFTILGAGLCLAAANTVAPKVASKKKKGSN